MRYIALLRGVNVGGNKKIKMAALRASLTDAGYAHVKTTLASGNVAFDADEETTDTLAAALSEIIENEFGFPVPVIVLQQAILTDFVAQDPFADVVITDDTRLYVTFLPAAVSESTLDITLPYTVETDDYTILALTDTIVSSILTLSKTKRTTDAMKLLETHFGKHITTRNWNTVQKLVSL